MLIFCFFVVLVSIPFFFISHTIFHKVKIVSERTPQHRHDGWILQH